MQLYFVVVHPDPDRVLEWNAHAAAWVPVGDGTRFRSRLEASVAAAAIDAVHGLRPRIEDHIDRSIDYSGSVRHGHAWQAENNRFGGYGAAP